MVLGNVVLAGAVVVILGGLTIIKANEIKNQCNRIISGDTKVNDETKEYVDSIEELYANAEKVLNRKYAKPLADNEIEMLNDLLQRAKHDDRFKDKMEKIDFWFITYESILANCRGNKINFNETKYEMESGR